MLNLLFQTYKVLKQYIFKDYPSENIKLVLSHPTPGNTDQPP